MFSLMLNKMNKLVHWDLLVIQNVANNTYITASPVMNSYLNKKICLSTEIFT